MSLLLLLAGCTSSYMRDAEPTGPPGPEEAKVIFYRTSLASSAVTFAVYDDEKLLGFTEKGNYFEVRCAPGKHLFTSGYVPFAGGAVDADLAPGKTYYIKSYVKNTAFFGIVWTVVGGLAPITRNSREWTRVERRLRRMECRELVPEAAAECGKSDPPEALRYRIEHSKKDAEILAQDDGKDGH
jgi:hypothetical protein